MHFLIGRVMASHEVNSTARIWGLKFWLSWCSAAHCRVRTQSVLLTLADQLNLVSCGALFAATFQCASNLWYTLTQGL